MDLGSAADSTEPPLVSAAEPLLNTDAEGVPRGACQKCGCVAWARSACSVLGPDVGAGEQHGLCDRDQPGADGDVSCECCGCPANAHESLTPWLDKVQRKMREMRSSTGEGLGPLRPYTLPAAAAHWQPMDAALFALTGGAFDPRQHGRRDGEGGLESRTAASSRGDILVSVVNPTCEDRHMFHPLLYECFCSQSYEPRELVVVDTGTRPSEFLEEQARRDPRLIYRFFQEPEAARREREESRRRARLQRQPNRCPRDPPEHRGAREPWSLGFKRNVACHLARGAVVAHFDDDDLYAPGYLGYMCSQLLRHEGAQRHRDLEEGAARGPCVATLTQWHLLDLEDLAFGFLDVRTDSWVPHLERRGWLYGWGFSYVFTGAAWRALPFPDAEFSEDISWVEALMSRGVPVELLELPVERAAHPQAVVAHTAHPSSCTGGEYAGCYSEAGLFVGWVRIGRAVKMPAAFEHLMPTVRDVLSSPAFEAHTSAARKRDPDRNAKIGLRKKSPFLRRLRCRVEGSAGGVSVQRLPQGRQWAREWWAGGGRAPWG